MRQASLLTALLCCIGLAAPTLQSDAAFEIEITGDLEGTLSGADADARRGLHPSGEGTELRIELDDDRDNCTLVLQINVGDAAEGQEEGTYELRDLLAGIEASRATIICEPLEIRGAQAKEGTLTITSSDEARVTGDLDYDAEVMLAGRSEPVAIHVVGTFTAEPGWY